MTEINTQENNTYLTPEQQNLLFGYTREIMPIVRKINELKEALKEAKLSSDGVAEAQQAVEDAKNVLANKIANDDNVKQLNDEIKARSKELTRALKAASKGVNKVYAPKELKAFYAARAKEKVGDVVEKGNLFSELDANIAAV